VTDKGPELTDDDQHQNDEVLDILWENFFITSDPADLAKFVRAGGSIDDKKTRKIIANFLDTAPHENAGAIIHH
jgi:hypothetical protein